MTSFKWYIAVVIVVIAHLLTQPFNVYSSLERRLLSTSIDLGWQELINQKFQDSLENTINDQMFAREWWIKVNTLKDTLLKRQIYEKVIQSEFGLHELWLEDSQQFTRNLAFLKAFENKYGALITVVPHSGSMLSPSYHEGSLLFSQQGYPTLRTWLLNTNQVSDYFYKADHHLNHLATPTMATYVLNQFGLETIMPSLKYCSTFSGTLAPYYLTWTPNLDSLWYYDSDIKSVVLNDLVYTSLHDTSICSSTNPYQALLRGNNALTQIETKATNEMKLLIIKDSHAHQLIPFLTPHYQHIDVVDLRHFNGSIEALIAQGYDDILVFVGEGSVRDDRNFFKLNR
jgi:alginate O-acetyltransferase complex protein AlgJ